MALTALIRGADSAGTTCTDDSPAEGQVGTRVTITGTNLFGVANGEEIVEVTLAGVPATIAENTAKGEVRTASAAKELKQASDYQAAYRRWMCYALLCCLLFVGFVIVVLRAK